MAGFLVLGLAFVSTVTIQACSDKAKFCDTWKQAGYCSPASPYYQHLETHCKKTCQLCGSPAPPGCVDKNAYCSSYKPYCNDPDYKDYLIDQCKLTCNYCHITTPPPTTTPFVPTTEYKGSGGRDLQPGCGKKGKSHSRIVGGKNANPGDWPWQVNFDYKNNAGNPGHWCGGTVITKDWVLSAAHCFYDDQNKDNYWLKLGEHDIKNPSKYEQRFTIKELLLHPKYKPNGYHYDLALVRIDGNVAFTDKVRPACLPGQNTTFDAGTTCYITGWGLLKEFGKGPAILQQAKVPLIDRNTCQKAYNPLNYDITPQMLCAGYQNGSIDACDGDSGGPLVCSKKDPVTREDIWFLWGAISWGVGCARKGLYGVFANTKIMRPWVDSVIFKNIV